MTKPLDQPRPTLRASVVAVPPRHRFTACIGRLSAAVGTGRARCLWKAAAVCWAEVLPVTAVDAGRALGPMLQSSAWEHWPFCVLRDSWHAALPDQPGLPPIGSVCRTGGSRRHPYPVILAIDGHCMDAAGAGPCWHGCVSVKPQVSGSNVPLSHLTTNAAVSRWQNGAVSCSCAFRRHAERPRRARSCRQVCSTRQRRSVRACARRVCVCLE